MQLRTMVNKTLHTANITATFDMISDVCVAGLGTAGAIAAISAAETGVSVIGIDRTAYLGGMGSAACVYDYFYGTQGGIAISVNEECYRRINRKKYISSGGREIRDESIPGIVKNTVLRERALKLGCKLLLECTVIGVFTEKNKVCGVQVFDGNKIINIRSKVLIDGTDGTLCRLAACEFLPARPSDGHTMQFSHMAAALENGRLRGIWKMCGFPDADSAEEWSKLILKSAPEYTQNRIVYEAAILGTREVLNVKTDEVYTLSDVASGKKISQPLFYGFSKVDNTNPDKENESRILQDWQVLCKMERYGISVGICAGTMIPQGKEGLMVVSRAKGLGHDLSSCIRMKYDMEKSGEAGGKIAALACKNGCSVREVSYEELRSILMESGCLNSCHDVGICDLNEPYRDKENGLLWRSVNLPETPDEYKAILSSREPGPAIWCIRNNCTDELRYVLKEWIKSDDRLLSENSAVALGITGDTDAIPMLRDILSKPATGYYYCVDKVKNILGWLMDSPYTNYTKAIILLGRFGDRAVVPKLKEIIANKGKALAENMIAEPGFPTKDVMAKEFSAFAAAAIREIDNPL